MPYRPPLHIHVLFHPSSSEGRQLAEALVPRFLSPPAVRGLHVPIFLTPDHGDNLPPSIQVNDPGHLNLDAAQHSVVVILADKYMQRRIDGGTGKQWADFTRSLIDDHDSGKHAVILVSLDQSGVRLDESLSQINYLVFNSDHDFAARREELTFQLSNSALQLVRGSNEHSMQEPRSKAPVNFFLSHAKADLKKREGETRPQGEIHRVMHEMAEMKVSHWYDAQDIELTAEFTDKIKQGISKADLMVLFLTDSWAKSSWCRMEAAYAKEVGTPILIVDALKDGEPRNFPYGGNVRVVRWPIPNEESVQELYRDLGTDAERQLRLQAIRPQAARMVLSASMLETLLRAHTIQLMKDLARPGQVPLSTSPEAVDLANNPHDSEFVYPDPPLTAEEQNILEALRPDASFVTPLIQTSRLLDSDRDLTVAISVSDSDVLSQHGLTQHHLRTISDEIHLYLLIAGLRIAYGGKLDPDNLYDEDNFTVRLFNLVTGYRYLAENIGKRFKPILNVAPWPLWELYDEKVLALFGTIADLKKVECPNLRIPAEAPQLEQLPSGFVVPNTPLHQYAWGQAMTAMRQLLTDQSFVVPDTGEEISIFARIVMGGKIEDYKGRYAGLIEEPLLSLRAGSPLFLIGSLGGCTRLVIDLLEQRDRPEMTTEVARQNVANYDEIAALYHKHGQEFKAREEVVEELKRLGVKGPAVALKNGLSDEQNRELFYCSEPRRIAELILNGLFKLLSTA